jgi:hypothetical protein
MSSFHIAGRLALTRVTRALTPLTGGLLLLLRPARR